MNDANIYYKLTKRKKMNKQIEETLKIAKEQFIAFGFNEVQMTKLLASGQRDLEQEMSKLKKLLETIPVDIEEINKLTHGLKGLFLNMGNHKVAEKLVDFRENSVDDEDVMKELLVYLKLDKEDTI